MTPGEFVKRESGLLVPKAADEMVPEEPPLGREVWTNDEHRALSRVAKMLNGRDVAFTLICRKPGCGPLEMGRDEASGAVTLTCGCKRREFSVR
ncbi:MAG: hypothetical protein ACE149_19600 [Armatimonadota bacterium]